MSGDRWPDAGVSDGPVVVGPRASTMRDRRARGPRGPLSLPGPLSPERVPIDRPGRDVFDTVVEQAAARLHASLQARLPDVTIVVEEAPLLPPDWTEPIPLVTALPTDADHTQVVIFRRPLTDRAESTDEVPSLVWEALVTQLALVWDCSAADVTDPPARP